MRRAGALLLVGVCILVCAAACSAEPEVIEVTATPEPVTESPSVSALTPVTLEVCASGCDFTSIQAAIDDAATVAGTTIDVLDPVHTEAGVTVGKDVTIRGQGAGLTVVQAHAEVGSDAGRVFLIQPGTEVTIAALTVRHGDATLEPEIRGLRRCGGGIANQGRLTLDAVDVRDNTASCGGGIWNRGAMTLTHTFVHDNVGDGLDPNPGHGCGSGGGVMHIEGPLRITASTISGNRAVGRGGGLHVACAGTAVIENSTVSGNSSDRQGGAIHVKGALTMTFSTVADNIAVVEAGGIYNRGQVSLRNSLFAGNEGGDCVIGSNESGRSPGSFHQNSGNWIQDSGCSPDLSGDPLLGDLADNGGPVPTHALLPGSPACDAIPAGQCHLPVDQRGVPRPQGAVCDIGAFEQEAD